MRKIYKFEGIDCANCAAKLEEKIKEIEGVTNASVNFITGKLSFEADDIKKVEKSVLKLIEKEEPDCELEMA